MSYYIRTEGTLSSTDTLIAVNCVGTSSGVISVKGTFTGTIAVTGSATEGAQEGGRLLFRSGVGSYGSNTIIGTGGLVDHEYRLITDGGMLYLRATDWSSGSAEISIGLSDASSITFINGPVHSAEEEAQRSGRGFSANTGTQSILAGQYLKYRFANPVGSGKRCFVYMRDFTNDRKANDTIPQTVFCVNPDPIDTPNTVTPINLITGGAPSTTEFTWKVDDTVLTNPASTRFLSINGIPLQLDKTWTRAVDPGQSFGYYIQGTAGGALQNALSASMLCLWYEEEYN